MGLYKPSSQLGRASSIPVHSEMFKRWTRPCSELPRPQTCASPFHPPEQVVLPQIKDAPCLGGQIPALGWVGAGRGVGCAVGWRSWARAGAWMGGFANPGIRREFCACSPLLGALGPVQPSGVLPKHVPSPQTVSGPSSPREGDGAAAGPCSLRPVPVLQSQGAISQVSPSLGTPWERQGGVGASLKTRLGRRDGCKVRRERRHRLPLPARPQRRQTDTAGPPEGCRQRWPSARSWNGPCRCW